MSSFKTFIVAYIVSLIAGIIGIIIICRIWMYVSNYRRQNIEIIRVIPYDNEGEYKKSFEDEMKKLSKEKTVFEYSGKGSLIKKLA